ncbi:MAG: UDP-N-acetylglucosamine--N-acetylmuramyl-(pentapeptide) pyrophosphoryl-undecaprenol [Chloroflexi bacterium]|jgi:UDP-N-acetylglucosamine--N-acetylmuramyl-(pentapeptide) pyrophosphoryl-undecaprenol N-acetylglucosamine transferase|nr:UDP-N-acetylglucosamine--N-acetylmuramyl-(pentapeptide) pyrophosphoryl-undecaprenol [Chloroflexota bacterium]
MSKNKIRILITGGGTGGHVSPALATVQEIKRLAENQAGEWSPVFRYIGSKHGVEKRLAEEAGLDFVGVQTGKLRRATNPLGMLTIKNLKDLFRIPVGVFQSLWHVARFKPDVIFSTGGFVCVPPVLAGWLLRVPVLTHEQTVTVGLANRIAARFARRIALSFEGAVSELPARLRTRTFVTGNPVRQIIFQGDAARAIERFNFNPADNDLPTLYVTGGAQGARVINQAVEAVLPELLQSARIIHQCGQQPAGETQDYDRLQAAADKLPPELRQRYFLTRFVGEEIGDVFALSNLVISRAGAGTVTEIAALGKAAVFVPLVPTGGDEQTRNAQRAEAVGAARIIKQSEMKGPRLLEEVRQLLADRPNLKEMGQKAGLLARPKAAHDLAEAVIELGRSK